MEPFEITYTGIILTVHPKEDGAFLITAAGEPYLEVFPVATENGTTWASKEAVAGEIVAEIGDLIEAHER